MVLEIASPDGKKGALTAFTLSGTNAKTVTVRLRGADAGRHYRVTLDNSGESFTVRGKELCMNGLVLDIPASLSSELVTYEAVD